MGRVELSLKPDHVLRRDGGRTVEQVVVRQPFAPRRELELRWR
jgi:hypothetical protein